MKVAVYYNLHTKRWSIRALQGDHKNCVIGHADGVLLEDASTHVSAAGRERVRREGRKNVQGTLRAVQGYRPRLGGWPHSSVLGYPEIEQCDTPGAPWDTWEPMTYNPYEYEHFVWKHDKASTEGTYLPFVTLTDNRKVWGCRFRNWSDQ